MIYVIQKDGSGPTAVTGTGLQATSPTWSPDGTRIAFQTRDSDFKFTVGIVNADGSGGMQTIIPPQQDPSAPNWQSGPCGGAGGDSDGDGLCDDWERNGLSVTANGNFLEPQLERSRSRGRRWRVSALLDNRG